MKNLFSEQALAVYRQLKNKSQTASEIGKKLKIFPNAVYRSIKPLVDAGIVEGTPEYPEKFKAKSNDETMSLLTLLFQQNLQGAFGLKENKQKLLQLTFIRTRDELVRMHIDDSKIAKNRINLISSGNELPGELILAYKRALDRGVKVRVIVQNLDKVMAEMFRNWKKMGVDVRYYPNIEARIFIFDHRIVYLTSYNPKDSQEAIGIRFDYAPYAKLMDDLFEQRWKLSKDLNY